MKKILIFIIVIIVSCSLYANDKKKLIILLRYRIEKNYFSNTVSSFIKALYENGFILGDNLEIKDFLTSTADLKSVPEVIKVINKYKNEADLFVTCGWISIYAREILKDTNKPQIFMPVLKSVALKLISSVKTPPHTNINGVYLQYPPEKIIKIVKLILPNIISYGYIYDSRIPADTTFKEAYKKLTESQKKEIKIFFFDLANGIDKVIKMIKLKNIQAIGGIVGLFKHLKIFNKLNIPIITSLTLDIEEKDLKKIIKNTNIVAGLFNPFSYCGYHAGLMAVKILKNGEYIGDIMPIPAKQIAFINLDAAKRLNIKIHFNAVDAVDIIIK